MDNNLIKFIKANKLEIIAVAAVILILIMFQWRIIGSHERMATHDTLLTYANLYYFLDSLSTGHFSYWDPYVNAGESHFIFWQLGFFLRPTMFIWLLLAKIFHISLFTVMHLEIFTLFIIFCLGSYLFFRKIFQSKISAYIAFIVITFCSLSVVYWWQVSFILTIYLLPWVLLFTFQFIEGEKKALIPLAFFLGLSAQAIHSMYFIFYYIILLLALWLTLRLENQSGLFEKINIQFIKLNSRYFLLFFIILILLVSYLLPQIPYKNNFVPYVKLFNATSDQISDNMAIAFETLRANDPSEIFNFFGLFLPQFSGQFFSEIIPWMPSQDTIMYIGLIPLVFLLIGLFWGRHKYKLGFIFTTVIIMFLYQGPSSFMMQFPYYFFPKFSWLDYMGLFYAFFLFSLCFFVGLGADRVLEDARLGDNRQFKKYYTLIAVMSVLYFVTVGGLAVSVFLFLKKNMGVFLQQKAVSGVWLTEKLAIIYPLILEMFFYTQLFLLIILFFFHILKKKEFSFKNRILFIVFFIIIDLLFINYPILNRTTTIQYKDMPEYPTKTEYSDFRLKEVKDYPRYLYAYAPMLMKQFSAYDPEKDKWPAHTIEAKDYYAFRQTKIPDAIKNIILGIDAPKLRLLPRAVIAPHDEIIKLLATSTIEQINKTAFIEEGIPSKFNLSNDEVNGKIEVTKFDVNRLELKVSSDKDSFLYYSDGYDKYWQAYIDGKKTKIYKTNMAFKSIILPAGEHKVTFIYNPLSFKIGLYAYLFTLFGLAPAIAIYSLIKRSKK